VKAVPPSAGRRKPTRRYTRAAPALPGRPADGGAVSFEGTLWPQAFYVADISRRMRMSGPQFPKAACAHQPVEHQHPARLQLARRAAGR
jgi:hypothetical protein